MNAETKARVKMERQKIGEEPGRRAARFGFVSDGQKTFGIVCLLVASYKIPYVRVCLNLCVCLAAAAAASRVNRIG